MYIESVVSIKKILIITSNYLPNPSANGINTNYIVNELKRRGHIVHCISIKRQNEGSFEIIEGTPIYRISPSLYTNLINKEQKVKKNFFNTVFFKLCRILRLLKLMLLIYKFPNNDILQSKKTYNKLKSIHQKEKFDCVIGVFKPYANIAALIKFKKENPNIICAAYYLDLINSIKKPYFMPSGFYKKILYKGDIETFKKVDFTLLAKGGKSVYDGGKYDCIREKIDYIDFPTFREVTMDTNTPKIQGQSIVLMYAGTLDREYRNPRYLLECLRALNKDIELNIYGQGNCEEILQEYSRGTLKIVNHGRVSQDIVIKSMLQSDFLINISNKIQNAVPSKIFEMFGTGKPIINLSFSKSDITQEYFDKYPSVLNINTWENTDTQIPKIINFLNEEKGKTYNILDIKKDFIENTPEYTVDIIERRINSFQS